MPNPLKDWWAHKDFEPWTRWLRVSFKPTTPSYTWRQLRRGPRKFRCNTDIFMSSSDLGRHLAPDYASAGGRQRSADPMRTRRKGAIHEADRTENRETGSRVRPQGPARFRRCAARPCRARDGERRPNLPLPVYAAWPEMARAARRLFGARARQSARSRCCGHGRRCEGDEPRAGRRKPRKQNKRGGRAIVSRCGC